MYKNAIVNASPSNTAVLVVPKRGVAFQDAKNLKTDFVMVANTKTVFFMEDFLLNHLDKCYQRLSKLMENATFVPNKKFNTRQGSVVLNEELIDLLSNQNRFLDANREVQYAPNTRGDIVKDLVQHKRAMFGELRDKRVR